jgi:hypothetical protein
MKTVISGCGKDLCDLACGDHIDTGNYIDDIEIVEPVLCDDCWKIQIAKELGGKR